MSKKIFYTFVIVHSLIFASEQQSVTHYQILPDEIICLIGISFSPAIQPKEANDFIKNMTLVNKKLCATLYPYIHDANYTRILINKIANNCNQNIVAKQLKLPGAQLYLNKNNPLHAQIVGFHENTIHRFFITGGDPNYFPAKKMPLAFVAVPDCIRVKMVLDHGANVDVRFNGETLLQYAIKIHHIPLIRLVLQYNPQDKCLRHAMEAEQSDIFEMIINSNNLSAKEIYRTFPCALKHLRLKAIQTFLNVGINPSYYLRQAILALRQYHYKKMHHKVRTLLNIIDLMCQHGAWDVKAYSIACTSKCIPSKVVGFLDNGRMKAIEKGLDKHK